MPNVMAALLNIGGALCWMLQRWADAQYWSAVQVERAAELQQCQVHLFTIYWLYANMIDHRR